MSQTPSTSSAPLGEFPDAETQELQQLQRWAAASLQEKIAWLEEAQQLALQFAEARRQQGLPTIDSHGNVI